MYGKSSKIVNLVIQSLIAVGAGILGIVFLSISLKTENNRYEWINYILYGSMVLVLGAYTLSNGTIYPYFFSKDAFPVVFFSILGVIILGVGIGVIVNSFKDEKDKRYSLLPLILPLAVANFSIFLVDILTVLTFPSSYGNRETALLQLNL